MHYSVIIYIVFGLLPSLIWLGYYLRKDAHPEPKGMIIRIFLWGVFITVPVFFVQIALTRILGMVDLSPMLKSVSYWFIVISFSEEYFKYLIIRFKVINSHHFDEPLDLMLYMVIAALGFSALENILYLFSPVGNLSLSQIVNRTLVVDIVRFIGATFLHTLCSAVVGYALALSACQAKRKFLYVLGGIILAVVLHGAYDFSIMTLGGGLRFGIPAVVIITLALIVFSGFEKLKKLKGICKVN
jgi:RsiW-degrading membrane proteinase PrsW (M82 family)